MMAAAMRAAGGLDVALPGRLAASLDKRFVRELRERGYDTATRRALLRIAPGAASRAASLAEFLEQVQYNGRRLAKLDASPASVLAAYDRYGKWLPSQSGAERLRLAVALTLDNSFFSVREEEAQAFFQLADAELQARSVDDLTGRAIKILSRTVNAQAGAWSWTKARRTQHECDPSGAGKICLLLARARGPQRPGEGVRAVRFCGALSLAAAGNSADPGGCGTLRGMGGPGAALRRIPGLSGEDSLAGGT
jgi:hypothetical protein